MLRFAGAKQLSAIGRWYPLPWISNARRLGRVLRPEGTRSQHGLLLRLPFALEALTVSGAQRKHLYNLEH
jgi:hypothetical protein